MDKQLYYEIGAWHVTTFPNATEEIQAAKLQEEATELRLELNNKNYRFAKEELADCFIVLIGIAVRMGLKYEGLVAELLVKHSANKKRKWTDAISPGFYKGKK